MKIKKKIIILAFIFIFIITSGFGCKGGSRQAREAMKPITLNYWRVWDGPDAFSDIITKYNAQHPNITINYKKLRYSEYEDALLEAFAEDRGPDIFSIHNTWIKKYINKIKPMPANITLAYQLLEGGIKKELITKMRTTKSITPQDIKTDFIDVVYDDVVIKEDKKGGEAKELIYGLPLSVDTLVMYYNKDLLNNAGIAEPPHFWNREFQRGVRKMTKQDNRGQIIQSGVALGGSFNITRSTDILSTLMMQNGAVMMENGVVKFHQLPTDISAEQGYNPGLEALRFYSDFANPSKEVYSWNGDLDNSMDMFIQGKLALMFGYSYHLPIIKAQAPKLNFLIANLPQIEGNSAGANYANYWVETVSKKILTDPKNFKEGKDYAKLKLDAAWDFIQFAARAKNVKSYLDNTKKPTALRSLIDEQIEDPDIGVFAKQLLTAESWYRGADADAAEEIMKQMIDDVVAGRDKIEKIISIGASRVQQTVGR